MKFMEPYCLLKAYFDQATKKGTHFNLDIPNLFVEETGGPRENHRPQVQVTNKLYHIMLYTSPWSIFELTTSVVIDTDCIGSCKSKQFYQY
jgi:hypothetical protein